MLLPGTGLARQTAVRQFLLLSAVIACARPPAHPEPGPISSDRPDFTDGVTIVARGHTQVEAGVTRSHDVGTDQWAIGELLLRRALAPRAELRLSAYSFDIEVTGAQRQRGVEDVGIGAKFLVHEAGEDAPRWKPSIGVEVNASLPTGSTAFRARHVLPLVKLLTAWDLSERVEFATNVNLAAVQGDAGLRSERAASGSLGVALTDRMAAFGEYFAISTPGDRLRRLDNLNAGLTFRITPSLQLDARAGIGPLPASQGYFTGAGLAYRW